jgi:phosphate uptake regulator
MYVRKLVKSGLSSNVIALPKEFLDDNKLKTGDTIVLERESKSQLVISAKPQPAKEESAMRVKTIEVGKRPMRHLEREIIEAYLKNYNEVIIELNSPTDAKAVKQYVGRLVAFEVVQEDTKRIIAKDFLNYQDRDIDRTLRRIQHIVGSMMADIKEIEKDPAIADIIMERDREVNRMGFLLMRILQVAVVSPNISSMLKLTPLKTLKFWSINTYLEKIGDETKRIGKKLSTTKNLKQRRKFFELWDSLITLYHVTMQALNGGSGATIDKNLDKRTELLTAIDKYGESKESRDMVEVISLMKQLASNLGDINRTIRYVGD